MSLFGTYWLSKANFILLCVFHFFQFLSLFLFFCGFYYLGIEVSLSILQIKHWNFSYILKWSFEGWVASAFFSIINVTGLVQFRERLSCILPPLVSLELLAAEYLHETNISSCIYHSLMATCYLDALKKSWRRKDMRIKRKKSRWYNKLYTVKRRQGSKRLGWLNSWLWLCIWWLE